MELPRAGVRDIYLACYSCEDLSLSSYLAQLPKLDLVHANLSYVSALFAKVPVAVHDPSQNVLNNAMSHLDKLFERDVAKGRWSKEETEAARARVTAVQGDGTSAGGGAGVHADTDLVIEVRTC